MTKNIENLKFKEECKDIIAHNILKLLEPQENNNKIISLFSLNMKLGLSDATMQKYVSRVQLPQVHILIKIADYFGITLDELVRKKL